MTEIWVDPKRGGNSLNVGEGLEGEISARYYVLGQCHRIKNDTLTT